MNEFTFFLRAVANVYKRGEGTYIQWFYTPRELYLLRWQTKFTYNTAVRHAKQVVADHLLSIARSDDPVICPHDFDRQWVVNHHNNGRSHYLVKPARPLMWGHGRIVRLEQPEHCK